MPNKLLIAVIGLAMIGLLIFPPLISCSKEHTLCLYSHKAIFEDWYTLGDSRVVGGSGLYMYQIDITRLALYELAVAGIGALIHFLTRK